MSKTTNRIITYIDEAIKAGEKRELNTGALKEAHKILKNLNKKEEQDLIKPIVDEITKIKHALTNRQSHELIISKRYELIKVLHEGFVKLRKVQHEIYQKRESLNADQVKQYYESLIQLLSQLIETEKELIHGDEVVKQVVTEINSLVQKDLIELIDKYASISNQIELTDAEHKIIRQIASELETITRNEQELGPLVELIKKDLQILAQKFRTYNPTRGDKTAQEASQFLASIHDATKDIKAKFTDDLVQKANEQIKHFSTAYDEMQKNLQVLQAILQKVQDYQESPTVSQPELQPVPEPSADTGAHQPVEPQPSTEPEPTPEENAAAQEQAQEEAEANVAQEEQRNEGHEEAVVEDLYADLNAEFRDFLQKYHELEKYQTNPDALKKLQEMYEEYVKINSNFTKIEGLRRNALASLRENYLLKKKINEAISGYDKYTEHEKNKLAEFLFEIAHLRTKISNAIKPITTNTEGRTEITDYVITDIEKEIKDFTGFGVIPNDGELHKIIVAFVNAFNNKPKGTEQNKLRDEISFYVQQQKAKEFANENPNINLPASIWDERIKSNNKEYTNLRSLLKNVETQTAKHEESKSAYEIYKSHYIRIRTELKVKKEAIEEFIKHHFKTQEHE